jgi:hypothetical protein
MMNVFDPSPSARLLASIAATLRSAFPAVMDVRVSNGNYMVLAFSQAVTVADVRERLQGVDAAGVFGELARGTASRVAEVEPSPEELVFTDDRAPVEEITRQVLVRE